jgi:flagellar biosynthesis/type III secretory pathway M-ring protein FliF/YscJ
LLLGLGLPQWLLIIGLVAALLLTFKVMARASVAYEKARQRREQMAQAPEETREEDRP